VRSLKCKEQVKRVPLNVFPSQENNNGLLLDIFVRTSLLGTMPKEGWLKGSLCEDALLIPIGPLSCKESKGAGKA